MKSNITRKPPYAFKLYTVSLKFLLILLPLLGISDFSYATDYYFSSSSGNDNYSTAQAQNSSTPWRSLEKLNSISNTLKAGDRVFFKRGDEFFGNLKISRGGSSGNPIIYSSYGTGAKPLISSMEQVTSWKSVGNGIYEAGLSLQAAEKIQVLSINGQLQEVGRYPNPDQADKGFLTIAGVNGYLSIRGSNLPANFDGGEVVIRKNNWIIDRHEITFSSGNTINFSANPSSSYVPQQGYGYFIQNHVNTLDKLGEWAYSKISRKIYVYFGSQPPGNFDVKIARGSHLIDVSRYIGNLSFSNLNFSGSNGNLINLENSNNIRVEDCDFNFAGQNAIYAHTTPDIQIRRNSIAYSLSGGIFFQFGTPRALIEENSINYTMPFQGMSESSDLRGNAIYIAADANNSSVARNQIRNTGFNGIHFGGNYTVVKNNFIDNYCLFKQDGGGIYTNSDGLTSMNNTGREIEGNIITRGIGFAEGSPIAYKLVEGIYIDDNAMGIRISGNTLSDISGRGIYFHNSRNIEVYENLFHKIPIQFLASHDMYGDPIRNVRIERNQFSTIYKDEVAFSITSIKNDLNQLGRLDNNYFLDPYQREILFKSHLVTQRGIGNSSSLQNWRDNMGYELNSISPDFNLQPYVINNSTTLKSSDFNSGISVVSGVNNLSSQAGSGINGGSWKISSGPDGNGVAYIQIGNITRGEEILVEFETRSASPDQTVELILEKTFQQNQEGTIFNFATSSEVKKVRMLMKSEVSSGNESVVFRFPSAVRDLLVDNLKISKVQTTAIQVENQVFFRYNYSDKSVSYPLDGKFKNAKGEVFSGSVNVPAYRSVLLARIEGGNEVPSSPPSVELIDPVQNQGYMVGEEIVIKATASSPNGPVQRVELYEGDRLLKSIVAQPYQFSINNAQVGNYTLWAKVIDEQNNVAESERVNIQVKQPEEQGRPAPNQRPTVSITSPGENESFAEGDRILIKTNASDPEGKIAKVEFFANNIQLGEVTRAPYDFLVEKAPVGTFSVKAKVYDDQGLVGESSTTIIAVGPSGDKSTGLQITYPRQNQVFSKGETVVIKTDVSDFGDNINKVEFYSNNYLLGFSSGPQYELSVGNVPVGSYAIKIKLINRQGSTYESNTVNVVVDDTANKQVNGTSQNQPPLIEIISPSQNQNLIAGQELVIKTSVWDFEDQIAGVEFYVGDSPLSSVKSPPYELKLPNIPSGNYVLTAKVFDREGLSSESSRVNIFVSDRNNYRVNSLELIKPLRNQSFQPSDTISVEIRGVETEPAYDSLQVLVKGENLGKTESLSFGLPAAQLPAGDHVLSVVAYNGGVKTDSSQVSVSIAKTALSPYLTKELEYTYRIGPNPTSDLLTVYMAGMYQPEVVQVQIFASNGVVLDEISTNTNLGSVSFDVGDYSPGVYFIRINGPVFSYETKRFIKK